MAGYELYLVRHAVAAPRGDAWPDDGLRPLTARGVSRFTEVVAGLRASGLSLDEIWTSPLVRARQTADLLRTGLPGRPRVRVLEPLASGASPAATLAALARHRPGRRIALVGHEPGLGLLTAALIGASRPVPFRKGGVCRIDVSRLRSGSGALIWMLPPRLLRALAR